VHKMDIPYVFFNPQIVRALRDRDEAFRKERETLGKVAERNMRSTANYLQGQEKNQYDYRG